MDRLRQRSIADAQQGMDIVRRRGRYLPKFVLPIVLLVAIAALVAWSVATVQRARRAPPVVDRSTIVTDVARKRTLVLSVPAQGVFVPEHIRVVSASQPGVVDDILAKAGSVVQPGTVIAKMDNPSLVAAVIATRSALRVARANLASAQEQARSVTIDRQAAVADSEALHAQDMLRVRTDRSLVRDGLIARVQYEDALIQEERTRNDLLKSRSQVGVASADAQAKIAAAQAQVDGAAAQLAANAAQVDALVVRAATAGIVQSIDVDPGTIVAQNTQIARVADVHDLKAVLQVAESDLRAVAVGMPARVSTANGSTVGHIVRIAPAARGGTVAVDVTFGDSPPPGALPSANVDAVIETAKIPDAVSIALPAGASDGTKLSVFKLVDGGSRAVRIRIALGRGSNNRVQVLNGLAPGDTVIVSDTSSLLDHVELRLR